MLAKRAKQNAKRPRAAEEEPASWEDLVPAHRAPAPPPKKRAAPSPSPAEESDDETMFAPEDIAPGDEIKYRHVLRGEPRCIKDGVVIKVDLHEDEAGGHCTLKVCSSRPGGGKITRTIDLRVVVAHTPQEVDSDDESEPESEEEQAEEQAEEVPAAAQPAGPRVADENNDDDFSDSDAEADEVDEADDGAGEADDPDYEQPKRKAPAQANRKARGGGGGDSDGSDANYSDSNPEDNGEESDGEESESDDGARAPPVVRGKLELSGAPSGYESDADPHSRGATECLRRGLMRRPRRAGADPLKNDGYDQAKQYRGWLAALLKVRPIPTEQEEEELDGAEYRPYMTYDTLQEWRRRIGGGPDANELVREHIARAFELDRGRPEAAKYIGNTMCALNLLREQHVVFPANA